MADSDAGSMDVLLVGLDAACPRVLDPVFEAGDAPTLQALFEDGTSGPLESQIPPWTASAWPSLYTGVNPGKHGVFGFLRFDGYDWSVVDSTCVREWSLWERADRHGLSSVVVNVPVTHPPPEIDGALLPGYVAPEDPVCHPEGLLDEVRDAVGEYRIYPRSEESGRDGTVRELRRLAEMRGAAFRYLAERFDPEFGFLQFQVTDTVLHEFPGDMDAARRVYEAVDETLGRTLETCDPSTVLVVSDHGMGPYTTRFRVNEFLREEGHVAATRGGDGMPAWSALRDGGLATGGGGGGGGNGSEETGHDAGGSGPGRPLTARAFALLARAGITSQRAGRVLDRLGLLEVAMQVVPTDAVRAASEQVDFPASRAYVRTRTESGVRINLAGREPQGTVPAEEYETVRSQLIRSLREVTTPDGKPAFDEVGPRESFFDGPHVEAAPDVVVVPRDFDVYLTTWLLGDRFEVPSEPTWDHTMTGVIAATGEGVDESADPGDAHLFDVAPTVLAALGIPAGERMDGAALPFVEPAGVEAYPDYRGESTGGTDDGGVEDRLAAMGYLE